jgi:hypothetical protein
MRGCLSVLYKHVTWSSANVFTIIDYALQHAVQDLLLHHLDWVWRSLEDFSREEIPMRGG